MVVDQPVRRKPRKIGRPAVRASEQPGSETREVSSGFDRGYWLRHCEGFRAESPAGRLGVVEEIRGGDVLAIRAGRLGRRLLIVPVAEVAFVVPRAERIWLRSSAVIATEAA